jgi:REP element-mobilizing transposase RayT
MQNEHVIPQRKSIRLKGYDYSNPGSYFITTSTRHHMCIFGEVKDATIHLFPIGNIVDECWKAIPQHYPEVRLESVQIMPNHLHAIITLEEHRAHGSQDVSLKNRSLSNIIGSFKSAVTRATHEAGHFRGRTIWQSRFYDHVIRDDVAFYFIQQYIELNPLIWEYSVRNPRSRTISQEELERILITKFGITGAALGMIMSSERLSEVNFKE